MKGQNGIHVHCVGKKCRNSLNLESSIHQNIPELVALKKIPKTTREPGKPLDKNQLARLAIINKCRKQSNHINNINVENPEAFFPSRRPTRSKYISEYAPCPKCSGWYSNSGLRKHAKICLKKSFKHSRALTSLSRQCVGDFHKAASTELMKELSDLTNDEVSKVIRHDEALIVYGNILSTRNQFTNHLGYLVRQKLRRLGRLLLAV